MSKSVKKVSPPPPPPPMECFSHGSGGAANQAKGQMTNRPARAAQMMSWSARAAQMISWSARAALYKSSKALISWPARAAHENGGKLSRKAIDKLACSGPRAITGGNWAEGTERNEKMRRKKPQEKKRTNIDQKNQKKTKEEK